jgi:hypothetical protein
MDGSTYVRITKMQVGEDSKRWWWGRGESEARRGRGREGEGGVWRVDGGGDAQKSVPTLFAGQGHSVAATLDCAPAPLHHLSVRTAICLRPRPRPCSPFACRSRLLLPRGIPRSSSHFTTWSAVSCCVAWRACVLRRDPGLG